MFSWFSFFCQFCAIADHFLLHWRLSFAKFLLALIWAKSVFFVLHSNSIKPFLFALIHSNGYFSDIDLLKIWLFDILTEITAEFAQESPRLKLDQISSFAHNPGPMGWMWTQNPDKRSKNDNYPLLWNKIIFGVKNENTKKKRKAARIVNSTNTELCTKFYPQLMHSSLARRWKSGKSWQEPEIIERCGHIRIFSEILSTFNLPKNLDNLFSTSTVPTCTATVAASLLVKFWQTEFLPRTSR